VREEGVILETCSRSRSDGPCADVDAAELDGDGVGDARKPAITRQCRRLPRGPTVDSVKRTHPPMSRSSAAIATTHRTSGGYVSRTAGAPAIARAPRSRGCVAKGLIEDGETAFEILVCRRSGGSRREDVS